MAEPTYLNFDIEIERQGESYRAQVVASPLDRACCSEFDLSLDEVRPGEWSSLDDIKAFGAGLFRNLFADELYSYLRLSQDEAERQRADGLRIRLILTEAPELADVPWEYLYDSGRDQFLGLSTKTPIVRYLDLSERVQSLAVAPPLRVLVMISSPKDQPPLDVNEEWVRLSGALADLQAAGRIELELLAEPTLPALQNRLREGEYHVFHYVGHGSFDESAQDGLLILEDEEGLSQPVRGDVLGALLHNEPTLRLALLSACEGAKASRVDPFAGTAQSLVRKQIPAVIAMQTVISDAAAKTFAAEFYRALADDYPVDKALTEARMAIYVQGNEREWAIPVLFMRASDARLEAGGEAAVVRAPEIVVPAEPEAPRGRRVQIGSMSIPLVPLMAVPAAVLVVALVLGAVLLGPGQMGGRFNVAIAQVGVLDGAGRARTTDESEQLTRWMVDEVLAADAASQEEHIALWHDGLPLTEKRTRLGVVAGQTAGDRALAAGELAKKVNAHVVLYGHLTAEDPPRFVLEFYVEPSQRLGLESTAVLGRYQLGEPIPVPPGVASDPLLVESVAARVESRASLAFWLVLALRADMLGNPSEALAILRDAEGQLTGLREQGDGKEHLYYLQGRAALFQNSFDEAEAALQRALRSNPAYARAQMALGSVYLDRAQTLQTPQQRLEDPADMQRAVTAYEEALRLAQAANEPLTEVIVRLALAGAYRLEAETLKSVSTPDLDAANRLYEQAIDELRLVVEPLDREHQYRLLAQAYATLGAAYLQHGQLLEIQGDRPGAKVEYEAAREAYAGCIAQGEGNRALEDDLLRAQIIGDAQNGCRRWADVTEEILQGFDGG